MGYSPKHHNFLINRKIREQTPPPSLLFAKILPTRRTQTNARTSASSPQGRACEYGGQSTHTPRKTPADRSPSPWLQINLAGVLEDTVARLLGPDETSQGSNGHPRLSRRRVYTLPWPSVSSRNRLPGPIQRLPGEQWTMNAITEHAFAERERQKRSRWKADRRRPTSFPTPAATETAVTVAAMHAALVPRGRGRNGPGFLRRRRLFLPQQAALWQRRFLCLSSLMLAFWRPPPYIPSRLVLRHDNPTFSHFSFLVSGLLCEQAEKWRGECGLSLGGWLTDSVSLPAVCTSDACAAKDAWMVCIETFRAFGYF